MRYLVIVIFISCTERSIERPWGYFEHMELSFDTIRIQTNHEILYLNNDLLGMDLSYDKKYLYNFNNYDHALEIINLDELRLERKIPFAKEGPNGTGEISSGIQVSGKDQIVIQGNIFSVTGEKIKSFHPQDFSNALNLFNYPISKPIFHEENELLYVLIKQFNNEKIFLGIFNLVNHEFTKQSLGAFMELENFTFNLMSGNNFVSTGPNIYMDKFGSKIILSNQVTSSILIYDISQNSLFLKIPKTCLFNDKKVNSYILNHEVEAWEKYLLEYSKFHEEINFIAPFWDEKNQLFFRFSYRELIGESIMVDKIKSKTYLSAYDKDFNPLGEIELLKFTDIPIDGTIRKFPKHFAKDGKIWIYENINDEMGFVVLTMSK